MISQLDNWYTERWQKFTASEIYKLLPTGKDGKGFSVGGKSYIEQKAIESLTTFWERPELEFVEPLLHGKIHEENSYKDYVRTTKNYSMRHCGGENPVFLEYNDYSGGSPDGLLGEADIIHWLWEGKCPQNPKNHYLYLQMQSQWDLKEKRIEYYSQIQFLLMITKAQGAHFTSYDERWKDKKLQLKIIDVYPDQKFQDNLDIRLQLAQKERIKLIQELKEKT